MADSVVPKFSKETYWRKHLARQRESTTAVRVYCRENSISPWAFYYWQRKFRKIDAANNNEREIAPASQRHGAFAEIVVKSPQGADAEETAGIEIRCACGCSIRIARGFDADALGRVLGVLKERDHC